MMRHRDRRRSDRRIEQCEIHLLAPSAVPIAMVQGYQDRAERVQAADEVRDWHAHAHRSALRRVVRRTGRAHQPAHRLEHRVESGLRRSRPGLPEAGDRAVDQPRIEHGQARVVEPMAR
jgi:hypothetical protein